jgi:hypothetical protein
MKGFLAQIDKLDNLEFFELTPSYVNFSLETSDLKPFIKEFAHKVSETVCCPKLHTLRIISCVSGQSTNVLDRLSSTRKLLHVRAVDSDDESSAESYDGDSN